MSMQVAGVRVRVVEIDGAPDLLSFARPGGFYFERDRDGIAAYGVAAMVEVEPGDGLGERAAAAAAALLAGAGPDALVVGALPFDERSDTTLLFVPDVAVVRRAGRTYAVLAGDADMPRPVWSAPAERVPPSTRAVRRADPLPDHYTASVRSAIEMIRAGALEKVVLARSVVVDGVEDATLDARAILSRLRDADRSAYAFAVDGMIGATPELLVSRHGRAVRSQPLAGSARRGEPGDDDARAARGLLESAKDRAEHAFVANAVAASLTPVCDGIHVDAQPSLLATSRVWHLATTVRGTLRDTSMNALALAARLHPTPAVCGTPRDRALDAIRSLEHIDRGLYAGLVGWMDGRGDGEWAIALRCAHIEGDTLRLFAGAGIVAASDPDAELAETEAKLEVLLRALGA